MFRWCPDSCLCGGSAVCVYAKAAKAAATGEQVHYYNGASRVDVVLSLDELAVDAPAGADAVGAVVPGASAKVIEGTTAQAVTLQSKSADRAALQQVADSFKAKGYTVKAVLRTTAGGPSQYLTNRLSAKFPAGAKVDAVLAAANLSIVEQVTYSENTYILQANGGLLASLDAANSLYESGKAEWRRRLSSNSRRRSSSQTPSSRPVALRNTVQAAAAGGRGNDINVVTAWDSADGTGVNIAIVDGHQTSHEDLSANARTDIDIDINGGDNDPSPTSSDIHGTPCAGLAAGVGNNSLGVTGAAFASKLVGVRLIAAPATDAQEAQAFNHQVAPALAADRVHVSSNSWGPADDGVTVATFGPLAGAALLNAVTNGRGGRGSSCGGRQRA